MRRLVPLLLLAGCPDGGEVAPPDAADACAGRPDESPCTLEGFPRTFCIDGVCVPSVCGDGRIGPTETCEESWAGAESCIDTDWGDYGELTCGSFCRASPDRCGDIGWQAVPFEFGTIEGMQRDWFATDRALVTLIKENDDLFWGEVGPDLAISYQGVWTNFAFTFAVGFGRPDDGAVKTAYAVRSAWAVQEFADRRLRAVWGRSEDDVYAVGAVLDPDAPYPDDELGAFAVHFDGVSWSPMAVPPGTGPLEGVWVDASRGYAVGADGAILRLEGDAWVADASPIADDAGVEPDPRLYAVTGGLTGVFAVGEGGTALRLDGDLWELQSTPTLVTLHAVTDHHDAGEAIAAGEDGVILHYDGHLWAESVTDGATAGQDLHAASETSVGGEATTFDYEGVDFGRMLAPPVDVDVVAGTGADYRVSRVVAAGGCTLYESTGDASWIVRPFPACMPCDAVLVAAWADLDQAFVVAASGQILHERDGGWSCDDLPAPPTPVRLAAIGGTAPGDITVVGAAIDGSRAVALRFDGAQWVDESAQVETLATGLAGVWSNGAVTWAVGAGGAILRRDAAGWTLVPSPIDADLAAIDGADDGTVIAAGAGGAMLRLAGADWVPVDARTTDDLFEVIALDAGDLLAAGPGTLHHQSYLGVWSPVRLPEGVRIADAWAVKGRIYLATEGSGLMRLQNTLW